MIRRVTSPGRVHMFWRYNLARYVHQMYTSWIYRAVAARIYFCVTEHVFGLEKARELPQNVPDIPVLKMRNKNWHKSWQVLNILCAVLLRSPLWDQNFLSRQRVIYPMMRYQMKEARNARIWVDSSLYILEYSWPRSHMWRTPTGYESMGEKTLFLPATWLLLWSCAHSNIFHAMTGPHI